MKTMGRAWAILKMTFSVFHGNPRLLLFPLLAFPACLVILVSFVVPLLVAAHVHAAPTANLFDWFLIRKGSEITGLTPWGWLAVLENIPIMFLMYLTGIFFNVAMTRVVLEALRGETCGVAEALRFAWSRLGPILGYSALATTVGILIRFIGGRSRLIGSLSTTLAGMAWSLGTYLVVPVIVQERRGGFGAVRRAAELFKRTWGETTISTGFLILFVVPVFALVLACSWASYALAEAFIPFLAVSNMAAVAGFLCGMVLSFAAMDIMSTVFKAALYIYAAEGEIPKAFRGPEFDTIWVVR